MTPSQKAHNRLLGAIKNGRTNVFALGVMSLLVAVQNAMAGNVVMTLVGGLAVVFYVNQFSNLQELVELINRSEKENKDEVQKS